MIDGKTKIKLEGERQRYTVMAHDDRYVILTKPINIYRTYLYTIADMLIKVRGPCNLIFGVPDGMELNTLEGAAEGLIWLQTKQMSVSGRRCVDMHPSEIAQLQTKETADA